MQKFRKHIRSTPFIWVACVVPVLLFMLSIQLHVHVHADHQHGTEVEQHSHEAKLHKAHLGSTHDAEHGFDQHASEVGTYAIDISPEGLNKSLASLFLVCALVSTLVLLLSQPTQGVALRRRSETTVPFHRRHTALPPQLRAPPR